MPNPIFILIDFNNYFTRFYFSNKETCVERYLKFLKHIRQKFNPTWLVNLMDAPKNFRSEFYPEYKGNRPVKPEDFNFLRENCILNLKKFNWPIQTSKTLEAEDLANLFTKNGKRLFPDVKFIIISDDKDCLPIESKDEQGNSTVLIFNYTGIQEGSQELFKQKSFRNFEMETPEEYTLFLTLKGDACDNVPGVEGIGDVGAKRLVTKYKTFENIKEILEKETQNHAVPASKLSFLELLKEVENEKIEEFEKYKDLDKVRADYDNFLLSYRLIKLFEGEWEYDLERYKI